MKCNNIEKTKKFKIYTKHKFECKCQINETKNNQNKMKDGRKYYVLYSILFMNCIINDKTT